MEKERIKAIRERLGVSQAEFARRYGINLRVLERWERLGASGSVALSYLAVIERDPQTVARLLGHEQQKPRRKRGFVKAGEKFNARKESMK